MSDTPSTTIVLEQDDAALVIREHGGIEFLIPSRPDDQEVEEYIMFLIAAGILYGRGGPEVQQFIQDIIGDDIDQDLTSKPN